MPIKALGAAKPRQRLDKGYCKLPKVADRGAASPRPDSQGSLDPHAQASALKQLLMRAKRARHQAPSAQRPPSQMEAFDTLEATLGREFAMTQPGGRCEAMGRYSAFLKGVPQVWPRLTAARAYINRGGGL